MKTHPFLFLGLVVLIVSGFSAFHAMRSLNDEEALPVDVTISLMFGLLLTLFGALSSIPDFRSSKGIKQLNAVKREEFLDHPSFRRYNHRANWFRELVEKI